MSSTLHLKVENPANGHADSDRSVLISSLEVFERLDCMKDILPQYQVVGVSSINCRSSCRHIGTIGQFAADVETCLAQWER